MMVTLFNCQTLGLAMHFQYSFCPISSTLGHLCEREKKNVVEYCRILQSWTSTRGIGHTFVVWKCFLGTSLYFSMYGMEYGPWIPLTDVREKKSSFEIEYGLSRKRPVAHVHLNFGLILAKFPPYLVLSWGGLLLTKHTKNKTHQFWILYLVHEFETSEWVWKLDINLNVLKWGFCFSSTHLSCWVL